MRALGILGPRRAGVRTQGAGPLETWISLCPHSHPGNLGEVEGPGVCRRSGPQSVGSRKSLLLSNALGRSGSVSAKTRKYENSLFRRGRPSTHF